jgi:acetyl-CoA acetyltransferase family protein
MIRDVVITHGIRTPFCKFGTALRDVPARELGRVVVRELVERAEIDPAMVDHVIMGNVAGPADATNIARVIALQAGLPDRVPAYTVNRNCASGMESIAHATRLITSGEAQVVVAGGTESMSQVPLYFRESAKDVFAEMGRARSTMDRLQSVTRFRPHHFAPLVGLQVGLTDAASGLNMGQTAEVLAKRFRISRELQDEFALRSHRRAIAARERLAEEIVPIYQAPDHYEVVAEDIGPREQQSLEALAKLTPVFDREWGTVTAGNACGITDGAAAVLVVSADKARELGMPQLGRVRSYAVAGVDPRQMGLGPAFATPLALERAHVSLQDVGLIEINEAFAAQVIANEMAFSSREFAETDLGRSAAIGEIDHERLNVNGGAIALGHPVGTSGTRLVLTLLKEMARRETSLGLATLCVGGGQGAAMVLER